MVRVAIVSLIVVFGLCASASAQVKVGDNINVLPVYKSTPPGEDPGPDDYLRGDLYGQRQGEPSIAFSTANPDHVVAFFNDFRAVNQPADNPLPDMTTKSFASRILNNVREFFAKLAGRPGRGKQTNADPDLAATGGEAWIGMSVSYDGGIYWIGGSVPGHHDDLTKASTSSPAFFGTPTNPIPHGGSDPVVASAPCGRFYLAFMSFIRNGESRLLVARFQDLNDSDLRHTIKYLGTTQVGQAMNATNGQLVDKPQMTIELTGKGACDATTITENVHVSYTTFVGGATGKFTSKINVASSYDGGKSYTVGKVDDSYTRSQGTALLWNPGSKDLYVFWRSFTVPNSIIFSKKAPKGQWSKPVDLLTLTGSAPMAPFDQQSVATTDPGALAAALAFRTNGFPAAGATPDGKYALVAWQERVRIDGTPDPNEQPRIVLMQYDVAGNRWSGRKVVAPLADSTNTPYGLGFFRGPTTTAGPQVMPSIACSVGNQCVITYFESRYQTSPPSGGWIAGFDNILDLRGAVVTPGTLPTPGPQFSASFQVSRYGYQPPTGWNQNTINQYLTQAQNGTLDANVLDNATQIVSPSSGEKYASVNYSGYPHTGAGTTPFMHDYNDTRSTVPFVLKKNAAGVDTWTVPTQASDLPAGAGFMAAWADNRFLVRPAGNDFTQYQFPTLQSSGSYSPCINPGSRDQSVMTARLGLGLLLTTSSNYKPIPPDGAEMTFPVTIWNNTGQDKVFSVQLATGSTAKASFGKAADAASGGYIYPLTDGERVVFAYSSSSFYVYVKDSGTGTPTPETPTPVTVTATELCGSVTYDAGGVRATCTTPSPDMKASLTLNSAAARAPALTPAFTYETPQIVANPVPKNPVPKNPVPKNPVPKNPVPKNTATPDPNDYVTVYDVIDYTVDIDVPPNFEPADVSSYLGLFNVDRAYVDSYIFQVFVSKPTYAYEVLNPDDCLGPVGNASSGTLIGHVSDPSNPVPKNPVPKNPVPKNPVPKNATLADAIVQNSTFTLGTGDTSNATNGTQTLANTSASTSLGCDGTNGAGLIAECTKAAPRTPNQVSITLRAYQIVPNPAKVYDPYQGCADCNAVAPPSLFVASASCTDLTDPKCVFLTDGPDLAVGATTALVEPGTQKAGLAVSFPYPNPVIVDNVGNRPALAHKIGYYISAAPTAADLPRNSDGTIRECPGSTGCSTSDPYTKRLLTIDAGPTAPLSSESITTQSLTIPVDIPRPNADGSGDYYIWGYVDTDRVVSELDEENNLVQGGVMVGTTLTPIKVTAPGYGFIGLQTPCTAGIVGDASTTNDPSCTKNGGGAVPIAWQFSENGVPVDTAGLVFELKFYHAQLNPDGSCSAQTPTDPNGYLAKAQPDPTDITTGNSGFQYFPTTGLLRPRYTWQFNWDRPSPPFTTPGCYQLWIEIPPAQVIGGGGSQLPALGPIKIRLQ